MKKLQPLNSLNDPNVIIVEDDNQKIFNELKEIKEEIIQVDLGLANIYLLVVADDELQYLKIFPDKTLYPFQNKLYVEGNFNNIKYVVRIIFINYVLFYDIYLYSDEKKIIKVLFGQDLKLNFEDLKYPFLNDGIRTPPNGDTVIIGPLSGSNCYLQSGSLINNVKYYTFHQKEKINSHYLLESPWIKIKDFTKLIFYEKIILDIKSFFGKDINLSSLINLYHSANK